MEPYSENSNNLASNDGVPEVEITVDFDWHSAEFGNTGAVSMTNEMLPHEVSENIDWTTWDSLFVDFQSNKAEYEPPDMTALDF